MFDARTVLFKPIRMRNTLTALSIVYALQSQAQGFSASPNNWSLPDGGLLQGGVTYGFNATGGAGSSSQNSGSQSWAIIDLNGDGQQDLVVTGSMNGGTYAQEFSPGGGSYWKLYANNGGGFNASSSNWSLPSGGMLEGGVTYGYNALGGSATSAQNNGSESWGIVDMDGDDRPDLVVTGALNGGAYAQEFSPGSGSYWKVYPNNGSGFDGSFVNWSLPTGGLLEGGITYGYNSLGGTASSTQNNGSESWALADMDGDGRADLVVTGSLNGGTYAQEFSPGSNSYWKVYHNNGSGFDASYLTWSLPDGGRLQGGVTYGFNALGGQVTVGQTPGSQNWALVDIGGDGKPDLVVTGQLIGSEDTEFSPATNSYWKYYGNTGSGFSATASNWSLPAGGKLQGGVTYGFNAVAGTAVSGQNTGSQSWSLADLDSDGRPDLVVTGELGSGAYAQEFSPGSNSYWKRFTNTGSGFATSYSNWSLPGGGRLEGGVTYGFNALAGTAASGQNSGSESWNVMDLNSDGSLDLVVTASYSSGPYAQEFSPGSGSYWKVYAGSGASGMLQQAHSPVIRLSPNPAAGSVRIESNADWKYMIAYDPMGRCVRAEPMGVAPMILDLNGWLPGPYVLRFVGDSGTHTERMIVLGTTEQR